MPEHRLQKTRATLPEGYQYGDQRNALVALEGPRRLRVGDVVRLYMPPDWFAQEDRKPAEPSEDALWGV